jgi:hypothetical protein
MSYMEEKSKLSALKVSIADVALFDFDKDSNSFKPTPYDVLSTIKVLSYILNEQNKAVEKELDVLAEEAWKRPADQMTE